MILFGLCEGEVLLKLERNVDRFIIDREIDKEKEGKREREIERERGLREKWSPNQNLGTLRVKLTRTSLLYSNPRPVHTTETERRITEPLAVRLPEQFGFSEIYLVGWVFSIFIRVVLFTFLSYFRYFILFCCYFIKIRLFFKVIIRIAL